MTRRVSFRYTSFYRERAGDEPANDDYALEVLAPFLQDQGDE